MIRGVNGRLQLGYGNSWAGEGGTMSIGLTLDTSSNATFEGTIGSGAITSTGKISGTELEGTSLDINGNADISGTARIHSRLTFGGNVNNFIEGTGSSLDFKSNGEYYFKKGANTQLIIASGGNVGIGLTNPSEKLDVDGNIRVRGNIVGTTATTLIKNVITDQSYEGQAYYNPETLNAFAGAHRWATITVTNGKQGDRTTALTDLGGNPFRVGGNTTQVYFDASETEIVIEIDHTTEPLRHSGVVGMQFTNSGWRPERVKIEGYNGTTWTTGLDTTTNSETTVAAKIGLGSAGIQKTKFTLGNPANSSGGYMRISKIFGYDYKGVSSQDAVKSGTYYINRYDDSAHYSTIYPATDSTYNLGTSALRYAKIYADNLYGDGSNLTNLPTQTDNTRVARIGDTMTGNLTISKDNSKIVIDSNNNGQASVDINNSTLAARWILDDDDLLRVYNQTSTFDTFAIKSSGFVGVGTANPGGIFEVFKSGTGRTRGDFLVDEAGKYTIVGRLSTTSGDVSSFKVRDRLNRAYFDVNTASKYIAFNPEVGDITMQIASGYGFKVNTNQLVVDATNGNVGIGTTDPAAKLEVIQGPGGIAQNIINAAEQGFRFSTKVEDTSVNSPVFRQGIYHNTTENASIAFYRGGSSVGGFMTFQTQNGNERMRINAGGNVGIGTTSPSVRLQVDGNAYIGTGAVDDNLALRVYGNNAGVSKYLELAHTNASSSRVKTDNTYLSLESGGYILLSNSGLFYGDTLILNNKKIKYGESNGGWRDVMYLGTDNVFRIGTISSMSSGGDTAIYHSGSEKVRITSSGVGIGTTNPSSQFNVHKNALSPAVIELSNTVTSGNDGVVIAQIKANTLNEELTRIETQNSSDSHDNGNLLFYNRNGYTNTFAESMRISGEGNVGIGTTSPTFKLDVVGDGIRTIRSTAGWAGWFENTGSSSGVIVTAGVDSGDAPLLIRKQDGTELFSVRGNGTSFFTNGNVGIGTTSPAALLSLSQPISGDTTMLLGRRAGKASIKSDATDGGYLILDSHANAVALNHYSSNNVWLATGGGNVGIGTTSPTTKLHVVGDGLVTGKITSSGGNSDQWNTAYAYTQVGHLPLSGGTLTGNVNIGANKYNLTVNTPTTLVTSIVNDTINVTFTASTTTNIDNYLIFSSVAGGDYGLISVIPPADFGATMSIIDDSFNTGGSQAYRVYAVKNGVYSSPLTGTKSFTVGTVEPTNMSVINLNTAYYIQYDAPSAKERFISSYNIYKHEHATQTSLDRSSATLIYSGMNNSYMYAISGVDNNNFHQFWVEVTTT